MFVDVITHKPNDTRSTCYHVNMETLETTQDLPTELQENKFPTITGVLEFDNNEEKLARLRSAYELIVQNRSLWIMTVTDQYHADSGQRLMILEWHPVPEAHLKPKIVVLSHVNGESSSTNEPMTLVLRYGTLVHLMFDPSFTTVLLYFAIPSRPGDLVLINLTYPTCDDVEELDEDVTEFEVRGNIPRLLWRRHGVSPCR
jgi:hypothetical protein